MEEKPGRWEDMLMVSGGGGWVGTAGSQGCLPAAAGPGIPRGQGRWCWHLVSTKRVRCLECSISSGTGLEQVGPWGARVPTQGIVEMGGCKLDNPKLCVLALVMWLVNGKQPFRINVFPKRAPECCMLNTIYLSSCAFTKGAGSPGHSSQNATSAWNNPLGGCLLFSSPAVGAPGLSPEGLG
jgi:hypothetical protein